MNFELFRNQFVFTAEDKEDAGLDINDEVSEDEFEQTLIATFLEAFANNQKLIDCVDDFESLVMKFLKEPAEKEGFDLEVSCGPDWKSLDQKGQEKLIPKYFTVIFYFNKFVYPKRVYRDYYAIEIDYFTESKQFCVGFDCFDPRDVFIYPPDSIIEVIALMMKSNQITC